MASGLNTISSEVFHKQSATLCWIWILQVGVWNFREATFVESIKQFIGLLKESPSGAVFNPWWQVDKQNDIGRNAPLIRRKHLRAYLRNGSARQKSL